MNRPYPVLSMLHFTVSRDEALSPAANWVLELMDTREEIERATVAKVTSANVAS